MEMGPVEIVVLSFWILDLEKEILDASRCMYIEFMVNCCDLVCEITSHILYVLKCSIVT